MNKSDCFYLGQVSKKYSYKGEVIIKLDTDEPESYVGLDAVFIEMGPNLVPYFIEKIALHRRNELRVQFEDMYSEEAAAPILKKAVYLPVEFLPELDDDQFYYHEVIGFEMEDTNHGRVGTIEGINDSTAQALFIVKDGEREILVPLVDDFIDKIDKASKKVIVTTPEGLIGINEN